MQHINSLDRSFAVLTYFLATKDVNKVNNGKTCRDLSGGEVNINKAIQLANANLAKLEGINKTISISEHNLRKSHPIQLTSMNPYPCSETTLNLYCEDNRYAKRLILLGRGSKPLTSSSYQQLLAGIPCDAQCISSDSDFFIGWNNFVKIYRRDLYDVLLVYIDGNGMEHFLYTPELKVEDKKLTISASRNSLWNFTMKKLMDSASGSAIGIKSWKMYLKEKDS